MSKCERPPAGWYCTREKGHEGPCATLPEGHVLSSKEADRQIKAAVKMGRGTRTRVKVPRKMYALLYSVAFWLLQRSYPECPTVFRVGHAGDYQCHVTKWVDDGTQIVGYLRPMVDGVGKCN